jgi:phage tail sheath protein FI
MDRLHPGVYIQEIPSGVQPIEAVSTSTAAFIGRTEMGPLGEAGLVTSMAEFTASYGSFVQATFLPHSVLQFFNNGGKKAYIVRVAPNGAVAAAISIKNRLASPTTSMTISAASEGDWGNKLDVAIVDSLTDPNNLFTIQVFRNRSDLNPPLSPLLLETIADVSIDPAAPNYVAKAAAAKSNYISVQVDPNSTGSAVAGTSRGGQLPIGNGADVLKLGTANGGVEAAGAAGPPPTLGTSTSGASPSVNPPVDKRVISINLDNDGPTDVQIPVTAATGADIATAIQAAVRAKRAANPTKQAAYDNFTCTFGTTYVLTSGSKGAGSSVVVANSAAPISLPAGQYNFQIAINGDGPHPVILNGPLADGPTIAAAIVTAVKAITAARTANQPAFAGFACVYDVGSTAGNPSLLLTSGTAGTGSTVQVTNGATPSVASTLKLGQANTGTEISGASPLRPAVSAVPTNYHLGTASITGSIVSVVMGKDNGLPGDQDHINGLSALDAVHDVNIIAIPGIGSTAVVDAGTNYCTQRADCFFIGDMNSYDATLDDARNFVNSLTVKSSYGAVYYPWLLTLDPTGASSQPILTPPSGYVAGMYARIDASRGVFKAPAGTEAYVGGSVGLAAMTSDAQQDFLNPIGVNVIRSFPASGIVIWGARTLATVSDPEYRYIPVRRTAIFLEQSIYASIRYAVFEPNDTGLWSSLRLNINAFMMLQFRAGAFQGKTPTDAFFVKVDETTTTQADIDAGTVNILVGFAPLKPAEFVVLQLTQKVNQAA